MMPYTTYRPVVQTSYYAPAVAAPVMAAPACATGTCGVAPTSTYYQPAAVAPVMTAPAPAISQPGCCGASSSSSTFAAPTLNATSYYVPSSAVNSATVSSQIPQATFSRASDAIANPKVESATSPAPAAKDNEGKSETAPLPRLLDPTEPHDIGRSRLVVHTRRFEGCAAIRVASSYRIARRRRMGSGSIVRRDPRYFHDPLARRFTLLNRLFHWFSGSQASAGNPLPRSSDSQASHAAGGNEYGSSASTASARRVSSDGASPQLNSMRFATA